MQEHIAQVKAAADYLRSRLTTIPRIGVLTGTGLGESLASLQVERTVPYAEIPHFPLSTVPGHYGQLLVGQLEQRGLLVFQGRFHLYEGYSARQVVFPVRVMQELGVRVLLVSNAAGGLNPGLAPGNLMIISDHINLTGANPLAGPNADCWGLRFPDMSRAYTADLAHLTLQAGAAAGGGVHRGVYVGLQGPSLETPAEIRYLKTIGADAVGFSTVLEVIAAVHAQMKVLGISTITNVHQPDNPEPATVEEILAVARAAAPRLDSVLSRVVLQLDQRLLGS